MDTSMDFLDDFRKASEVPGEIRRNQWIQWSQYVSVYFLKASQGISRHQKCCRIHRAEYAAKKQGSKNALEQRTILKNEENLFFKLSQELVQLKLCECQSCLRQAAAKQNPRSQQAHKDGNKVQLLSLVSFGFRRDMSDIKHIKHLIVTW